MIVRRVEALGRFLDTEDGKNLLAGYRRAANILRIEEKKDGRAYDGAPDLERSCRRAGGEGARRGPRPGAPRGWRAVGGEDFEGAMRALSRLRRPVDAFFDKVTVNAEDPRLRENRLRLLNAIPRRPARSPISRASRADRRRNCATAQGHPSRCVRLGTAIPRRGL